MESQFNGSSPERLTLRLHYPAIAEVNENRANGKLDIEI